MEERKALVKMIKGADDIKEQGKSEFIKGIVEFMAYENKEIAADKKKTIVMVAVDANTNELISALSGNDAQICISLINIAKNSNEFRDVLITSVFNFLKIPKIVQGDIIRKYYRGIDIEKEGELNK